MNKEEAIIIECHYDTGLKLKDLVLWIKVLNCIIPNFDVEKKYPIDNGLPVTEASFQDCVGKFIEIAHDLASNWNKISDVYNENK